MSILHIVTSSHGSMLNSSTTLLLSLVNVGLNLNPTISTRGATYDGVFDTLDQPFQNPPENLDLIREVDVYRIGSDFPNLPLDFTFALIAKNTNVNVVYRPFTDWNTDNNTTATYIEMPDEVDQYLATPTGTSTGTQFPVADVQGEYRPA